MRQVGLVEQLRSSGCSAALVGMNACGGGVTLSFVDLLVSGELPGHEAAACIEQIESRVVLAGGSVGLRVL